MHAAVGGILATHGSIRASSTNARGERVRAWRAGILLCWEAASSKSSSAVRPSARSRSHRRWSHSKARGGVHRRREGGVGDDRSAGTTCTASEALYILREIVIAATVLTALPVAGTERYSAVSTTHVAVAVTTVTHAMAMTVAHLVLRRAHHGRMPITVSTTVSHRIAGWALHSRERAAEAGGTTLEVGKSARRAVPVTGTWSVLARGEWS